MFRLASCSPIIAALFVTGLTLVAGRASAQIRPAPTVAVEGVRHAIAAAEAEARKNNWKMSIAVVDPAGELVGFLRLDGAPLSSVDISLAKARASARFRRPTKVLDSLLNNGHLSILTMPGATAAEGAVPIRIGSDVVGAIGVSGGSSAQDAQVAAAGAAAVTP